MQTALVAGGAGFIGSHLCEYLLSQDFKVICVDSLITGSQDNVTKLQQNPSFIFIKFDITRPLSTIEQLNNVTIDFIFHLASPASPNQKSKTSYINLPIETLEVNSVGTHNLLKLAKNLNARFLFASTSEVYGDPLVSPQPEDYFGNVNPNGIRSVYDEAKRFGEAITMSYVREYQLDARIVRIFNTYGPHMQKDDGRVVSNFVTQALSGQALTIYGDGRQTRSFCYVSDMVLGIYKAMILDGLDGEVINLGNPKERTLLELASLVLDETGSSSKITHEELPEDDPKQRNPDISKAKRLLDWSPSVTMKEGLQKTIEYFKSV